nr:uncharacterized protein LOC123748769 [Procambarus clarkii]
MFSPGHPAAFFCLAVLMVTAENGKIRERETVVDAWPPWYLSEEIPREDEDEEVPVSVGREKQQQQGPGLFNSNEGPYLFSEPLIQANEGPDSLLRSDEGRDWYPGDAASHDPYPAGGNLDQAANAITDGTFDDVTNAVLTDLGVHCSHVDRLEAIIEAVMTDWGVHCSRDDRLGAIIEAVLTDWGVHCSRDDRLGAIIVAVLTDWGVHCSHVDRLEAIIVAVMTDWGVHCSRDDRL